jgi:hypothetical protein
MLTEKCPACGSFNDVEAAVCYFCHKDLPDTPGHKKKRGAKPSDKQSIALPPSIASGARIKSPPGCLIGFVGILILISLGVIFQWVNSTYHLVQVRLPLPSNEVGIYSAYYLAGLTGWIDKLLEYPIIVVTSILMIGILCWGLLNLKPWSRALVLMILVILLVGNIALFVTFVKGFVNTIENDITFLMILIGIILNIYFLVWFFERKKTFE